MSNDSKALSRINALLDDNSFVELMGAVTARSTDFNLDAAQTPSDGVIVGHGLIDGNLCFVFAQDAAVLNGSIGEMHAKKINSIYEMALKTGAPVVGLLDCSGVRLQESCDALEALGSVVYTATCASGVIPQLMCVMGNCGGGLASLVGLADVAFMENSAKLFVNSPDAIEGNFAGKCDTASAKFQYEESHNIDFVGSESEIYSAVKKAIAMLPGCDGDIAMDETTDDLNRASDIASCLDDASAIAKELADNKDVLEIGGGHKCMFTGLVKLDGITCGIVGPKSSEVCAGGLKKAADFINFCDDFSVPVITVANVTGYKATMMSEKKIVDAMKDFAKAIAGCSVPKINLISKDAFGSAYALFNSKAMGADLVYAVDSARIGAMDPAKASKILDGAAYDVSANEAARRGCVDRIVSAADTRKYVIAGLEMLLGMLAR